MRCFFWHIILFCFLILLASTQLMGQDTLFLHSTEENYLIEPQKMAILVDPTNQLGIRDVLLADYDSTFRPTSQKFPHPEDMDATYWIRFTFGGEALKSNTWYLEMLCQTTTEVAFFYPNANGSYSMRESGMKYPFSRREFKHKNFVFELPATEPFPTCYVRVKTTNPVHFLYKIRTDNYFIGYSLAEYFYLGLFYGVLLIMGIYNLVLYFVIRERFYLFYVLYVISCMLISFEDGLGFHFFWPDSPGFNQFAYRYSPVIFLICFTAYANAFMEFDQVWPKFYRWFMGLVGFSVIFFVIREQISNAAWQVPIYLIPFLVLYIAALWRWRRGYQEGRFFVIAFSFTIVGIIITAMRRNTIIEWDNLALVYTLNFALLVEIVLLSFAQGIKFRLTKARQQQAQEAMITNLQELNQIKEKINLEIEQKVELQTREITVQKNLIEQQNEQLASANRKLQTQAAEIQRINRLLDQENQELKGNVKELTRARVFAREVDFAEFQGFFPDDNACYHYLAKLKWEKGYACQRCGNSKYTEGQQPYSRRCSKCGSSESTTAHTLFHRLHFPILKGFYLLFLVYANKGNISATELAEIVDLRYQTCWKFSKKVQEKMKTVSLEENDDPQIDGWSALILQ